jgi:hypothetical protein
MDGPFSLRDACMDAGSRATQGAIAEKVRMRGSNKAFCLVFILLGNRSLRCSTTCIHAVVTPTLSSRRVGFFLNLMAVTRPEELCTDSE